MPIPKRPKFEYFGLMGIRCNEFLVFFGVMSFGVMAFGVTGINRIFFIIQFRPVTPNFSV